MAKSTSRVILLSLYALLWVSSGKASLITNGGFETGNFSGWTTTPAALGSNFGVGTSYPHSGNYSAYFAGSVVGSYDAISQSIATELGESFQLNFWLSIDPNGLSPFILAEHSIPDGSPSSPAIDNFQVLWNGVVVDAISSSTFTSYTEYTVTIPAATSAGTGTLAFDAYNSGVGTYLDDVSLTPINAATPEPRTTWLVSLALLSLGLLNVIGKFRRAF